MKKEDHWNKCLSLLLEGRYDIGFPKHEWVMSGSQKFSHSYKATETLSHPIWRGEKEPINLLVNADFGMGDTIQFWRFVSSAKDRVAQIILRCDEDLHKLFQNVQVVSKDASIPTFDKITHMMCLPKVLGIKEISGKSYIKQNNSSRAFGEDDRFRVGVCWNGNPFNGRDMIRSMPDRFWGEFDKKINLKKIKLYSLDKLYGPPNINYINCLNYMKNWTDTASLISGLNLVITVDTAVAHLAGALGVPVWTIVSVDHPDWRWGLEGDKTAWYDSMTLFRNNNWKDTINNIATFLNSSFNSIS